MIALPSISGGFSMDFTRIAAVVSLGTRPLSRAPVELALTQ